MFLCCVMFALLDQPLDHGAVVLVLLLQPETFACQLLLDTAFLTKPFTLGVPCPKCGTGELAEKKSRKGKIFYSCTRWPDCDYALWDKPVAHPCPNGDSPLMVEKTYKSGTALVCPKCRAKVAAEPTGA